MEAGYNSHRYNSEPHMGGDGMFGQGGPFSTSPYGYHSPPLIKSRSNPREGSHFPEYITEDTLARKLSNLTSALNQGKPISVDDLMSLRTDNEVTMLIFISKLFF
jgi:cyclin-dependent kinase 12/13